MTTTPAGSATKPVTARSKWLILAAVGMCLFLGSVDGSIVNVALPTLMAEFDASFAAIQWVTLAYLIGLTILLVGMGRLADIMGKKLIFSTGIVLFLAGSALCGLAPGVAWLIGFRFLQSIGAAMIIALGVAILTETWPPRERGKVIGFSAGFISLGIVFGPAIGGIMLEYLSWHWIFFVNLPLGAIALVLVLLYLPPLRPSGHRETFDLLGAVLLGIALLCATLALTAGQEFGLGSTLMFGLIAAAVVAFATFLYVESRVRYPMLDLRLFREPQFSLNLFTATLTFIAISGIVLLLPFYLELVLHLPLRMVGLLMAVVPLSMAFIQPLSGSLSDRFGTRRVSILGLIFIVLGYLLMAGIRVDGSELEFVLRMLPVAVGMATFNSPNNSAIMGAVPRARLGVASGTLGMVRTLGQVIGIAALGAFFSNRLNHYAGGTVGLRDADPAVIVAAMHDQFLAVACLVAIGLGIALLTWRWERRHGLRKADAAAKAAAITETATMEALAGE
jgi:EmrB/QacA subfamily drug resistance transporter